MATFTIEAPDGRRIKVEAETPELAMQGAQEWAAANPAKPAANSDGDVSVG
jgi:outer membrane PBP1 activator LpoA protein